MKKDSVIRVFFLICAALIIAAFWAGYYFGNAKKDASSSTAKSTSDLYLESETDASETMKDISETANQYLTADEADATNNKNEENDGTDMTELSENIYYLKKNGDYLSVYQSNSQDVYFETGIKISDLPENLQEKAETGIAFDSLEELYGFLENYSS